MKFVQGNRYHNPTLQFSIVKPEGWAFMPSAWALHMKEQYFEHTAEFEELVKSADLPFVHFYQYHEDANYPCPTVQCGCRWNEGVTLDQQLQEVTQDLTKYLPTSQILDATSQYILAGHRAIFVKFTFSVNTHRGIPIQCLGRTIAIARREYVFTIGLTGSVDEKYRCEEEFQKIIRSIQLGR